MIKGCASSLTVAFVVNQRREWPNSLHCREDQRYHLSIHLVAQRRFESERVDCEETSGDRLCSGLASAVPDQQFTGWRSTDADRIDTQLHIEKRGHDLVLLVVDW